MKNKKDDENEIVNNNAESVGEKNAKEAIEEQIQLLAEIIVDHLITIEYVNPNKNSAEE